MLQIRVVSIVTAAVLLLAGAARAAYPGKNGAIAYEEFASDDNGGGPYFTASEGIYVSSRPLTVCDNSSGPLTCLFGAPSYSADGRQITFSRLIPTDALRGKGGSGVIEILGADGSGGTVLPRQTADDERPEFLRAGQNIVFDGPTASTRQRNLYEVSVTGANLRQLTTAGGLRPVPCLNGRILFGRAGSLYVLSADHRRVVKIVGGQVNGWDCSPDSRQVAFARNCKIYTAGIDGKHQHAIKNVCTDQLRFSPNGRRIAYVDSVDQGNGSSEYLRIVNLAGRSVAPPTLVASTSFSGDSGVTYLGSTAGFGWQPLTAR